MKRVVALIILMAICVIFIGCSPKYGVTLTGYTINPNPASVNEPITLHLFGSEYSNDTIVKAFHWKIDDYDQEFVTSGNILPKVTFSAPGLKKVHVFVTSNYNNFITNELDFVVDVKDVPKN